MAFERTWAAVPPVLLTANGTTEGVVTVTDTAGFYAKQIAELSTNPPTTNLTVQIKRVVNSTTLWVGLPGPSMLHNLDVSAYTVASRSFISAAEQSKTTLPMEARMLATYEQEPLNAWRTRNVDSYGNGYTDSNPLPVNIFPATDIPFTLGSLTLPSLINTYIGTLTYTRVTSDSIGTEEVLMFYDGNTWVGEIYLSQTQDGWVLNLGGAEEDFLLLETGAFFVLEDDSGGILLE